MSSKKKYKKIYHPIIYYSLVVSKFLLNLLPFRLAFMLGGTGGKLAYYLVRRERRKILEHLNIAFGREKSPQEIKKIAQGVFEHYGKLLAEILCYEKIEKNFEKYVYFPDRKPLEDVIAKNKGSISIIAHFGNWEFLGGFTASRVHPSAVLAKKMYIDHYDRYMTKMRDHFKLQTIYRDASIRSMLQALKDKKMLGFAVDQDIDSVDGVFVNFFGRAAYTPTAPVKFAQLTGAPLVVCLIVRDGIRHRIIVEPEVELTVTGDKENDLQVNTQKWVSIQEKYIRQYPQQWVWNHKRWKTQPKSKI